jgi:hypothetical protein
VTLVRAESSLCAALAVGVTVTSDLRADPVIQDLHRVGGIGQGNTDALEELAPRAAIVAAALLAVPFDFEVAGLGLDAVFGLDLDAVFGHGHRDQNRTGRSQGGDQVGEQHLEKTWSWGLGAGWRLGVGGDNDVKMKMRIMARSFKNW